MVVITILTVAITGDSNKLEHGCRMVYGGCPSFFGFGFGGRSCSSCLASTLLVV